MLNPLMKLFAFLIVLGWCCIGCSHPLPHHLPDSNYYKQQEVSLLAAVCDQVMKPPLYIAPITKQDTIGIYDSLNFPHLSQKAMAKLDQEHQLSADFIRVLNDSTNWSQARHSTVTPPVLQIAAHVAFTPKLIVPKTDAPAAYRLSRVVFNANFSRAYFQLTWADAGGGTSKYVFCQKSDAGWVVQLAPTLNSFKF
ncbi:hypothetical protein EJV47_10025 [Hymenobacter gummosus]|uniref:Uncharacterized protein n=1 Tax=Hymenobacter gummosus TaxID=1776032 RepID=A0A431U5A1_9BACT|nr:hypothetical protein [Hymenobacter gummosus]RTQ50941.1 hypothetical protein EJV47_10025 [Hymenobacter gummosus]